MSTKTILSASSSDSFNKEFTLQNANLSVIELISGQQAIQQLQRTDDFINNLTHCKHVLLWDITSSQCITSCVEYINTTYINQLKLLTYPPRIFIVLTDGEDESDAAYCRNENVIVIPQEMIYSKGIRKIFIHELFHIWSKWNTNLAIRDELYASIGYHKIPTENQLEFPTNLYPRKITNPDAPFVMRYYINLKKQDDTSEKTYKCTPILYASRAFDINFSGRFFDYLVATTLILDDITYEPLQPLQYLSYQQASNFYDQIGYNTAYIIHPEEILAENFVLWMTATNNSIQIKTYDVINKMNNIISVAAGNASVTAPHKTDNTLS